MIEKIEIDLESFVLPRNWRRAEPACSDVKCNLPPVVLHRSKCESRFANHLRPTTHGLVRFPPLIERQRGPGLVLTDLLSCHIGSNALQSQISRSTNGTVEKCTDRSRIMGA